MLGIAGGREAQTGPFPMGTKAPSETKELRVVACDSLSDEHGTGLPPGVGEEAYLRLTLIRARAGFGQLWVLWLISYLISAHDIMSPEGVTQSREGLTREPLTLPHVHPARDRAVPLCHQMHLPGKKANPD